MKNGYLKIVIPLLIFATVAVLPKSAPNTITSRIFEIRNGSSINSLSDTVTLPGYNYTDVHWNDYDIPVPYNISDTTPISQRQAIQNAFKTWNDVPSSYINFSFAGVTTIGAPYMRDYTNVISFGPIDGPDGTLAYCVTWYYIASGELVEFDIVFDNSENWSTTTNCPPNCYDVQNVVTHEAGHALSLNDITDPAYAEQTMYAYTSSGETKKRTLAEGDIAGASYIYPASVPPVLIHDVAVQNITAQPTLGIQGQLISFNVTFKNEGDYNEILNANLKGNNSCIGNLQNIPITSKTTLTIQLAWNTSIMGDYTISCQLTPVIGEIDIIDNTACCSEIVRVIAATESDCSGGGMRPFRC